MDHLQRGDELILRAGGEIGGSLYTDMPGRGGGGIRREDESAHIHAPCGVRVGISKCGKSENINPASSFKKTAMLISLRTRAYLYRNPSDCDYYFAAYGA